MQLVVVYLSLFAVVSAATKNGLHLSLGASDQAHENALEAAWEEELEKQPAQVKYKSPIKRVVALLKKMKACLQSPIQAPMEGLTETLTEDPRNS